MRTRIMPNDTVKHRPSGETWFVCGVNHESGSLVPMGYPFPSIANVEDCELIERRYETEPQSEEQIKALQAHGLTGYIDARSACFHGIIRRKERSMERLTHERVNGIKTGYWSAATKETLVQRLAAYENTGLEPEEIGEAIKRAARESETKTATRMAECIAGAFRDVLEK